MAFVPLQHAPHGRSTAWWFLCSNHKVASQRLLPSGRESQCGLERCSNDEFCPGNASSSPLQPVVLAVPAPLRLGVAMGLALDCEK